MVGLWEPKKAQSVKLPLSAELSDMSSSVKLYVYDLSNGLAKQLSRQLTGRQIDGIWLASGPYICPVHTQRHSKAHICCRLRQRVLLWTRNQYHLSRPISRPYHFLVPLFLRFTSPKHGSPLQILDMGPTSIDGDTFDDYIAEMREHYTADKVSNSCSKWLTCDRGFALQYHLLGADLPLT